MFRLLRLVVIVVEVVDELVRSLFRSSSCLCHYVVVIVVVVGFVSFAGAPAQIVVHGNAIVVVATVGGCIGEGG